MKNWIITIDLIPGILFGVRSYIEEDHSIHVLYIGCFDIALTLFNEE